MNKEINTVVFDLDGTLFSSHKTIYLCVRKTFDLMGMQVNMPEEKFNKLIGHHFKDIFLEFGIYVNDIEGFIDIFKSHYFEFIKYSAPYQGVFEIIDYLNERGIKLALLTTKGQDQAERILEYFEVDDKFNCIMGRRPGVEIKPSAEPLEMILNILNVSAGQCLMVGDSELDILCGKNAGTLTAAVTYGYRNKEDLKKYNPDYMIDDILSIKTILNGVNKNE